MRPVIWKPILVVVGLALWLVVFAWGVNRIPYQNTHQLIFGALAWLLLATHLPRHVWLMVAVMVNPHPTPTSRVPWQGHFGLALLWGGCALLLRYALTSPWMPPGVLTMLVLSALLGRTRWLDGPEPR